MGKQGKGHNRSEARKKVHSSGKSHDNVGDDDAYEDAPGIDRLSVFLFIAVPVIVSCCIGELI